MSKRGPWSPEEDRQLRQEVESIGARHWTVIQKKIDGRSAKQCRERWNQNLNPILDHSPITEFEGGKIERLVRIHGKRWADIARQLPGRSDNAVKNWWNGGQNRRERLAVRQRDPSQAHSHQLPSELLTSATSLRRLEEYRAHEYPLPSPPYTSARGLPQGHQEPIRVPPRQQSLQTPLISPSYSERSMPSSIGDTPSLTTDSGSNPTGTPPQPTACSQSMPFMFDPSLPDTTKVLNRSYSAAAADSCHDAVSNPHQPAPSRLHEFSRIASRQPHSFPYAAYSVSSSSLRNPPHHEGFVNDISRPEMSRPAPRPWSPIDTSNTRTSYHPLSIPEQSTPYYSYQRHELVGNTHRYPSPEPNIRPPVPVSGPPLNYTKHTGPPASSRKRSGDTAELSEIQTSNKRNALSSILN